MKKVFILALSTVMVLALAAVSMATVTVSGEVVAKYNFESGADAAEGKIVFDGKVNDAVTAKIIYKYDTDKTGVFVDEYWFNVTGDLGALKVGKFGYGTKGNVDIVDGTVKDFKAEAGVAYTYEVDPFMLKVFWAPDQSYIEKPWFLVDKEDTSPLGDNAYVLSFCYAADRWGADLNYFASGSDRVYEEYFDYYKWHGYAGNIWVQPIDYLKIYAHFGGTDNEINYNYTTHIIGGLFTAMDGALTIRGEYGIYDYDPWYIENYDFDSWGVAIQYAAANGLTYKYTRQNKDYDSSVYSSGTSTSEFKVTYAF